MRVGKPLTDPDDPRHGSTTAYNHYGCRCAVCRKGERDRRKARKGLPPGDPRHGTQNAYGYHNCRCEICVQANNERSLANYQTERALRYARNYTRQGADGPKRYHQWTSADLEYLMARDANGVYLHKPKEAAAFLGRSVAAIGNARRRCRTEPKYQLMLGLPTL